MKRITVEMLKEKSACAEQVREFNKVFPNGATVSVRSAVKAMKAGLDISFLKRFFTATALAEYERVTATAIVAALGL